MIGNTVLWLSLIWLPLLLCFMLRNESKFKKNIAVGVTFPFEGRRHPDVLARLERFKKQELWVCVGLVLLALPCLFLNFVNGFTVWFIWLFLCVVVPYIPYVLCNRDLKHIKEANGWKRDLNTEITVDMSVIPDLKWLSPWAFVPAVILAILPMLWDRDFSLMYMLDAIFVILFWLSYRYLFRSKAEKVDDNVEVTQALTRMRQNQWGKMWLLCAYAMAALNIGISVTKYNHMGMIIVTVIFGVVLTAAAIYIEMRTRKLQEKLTADSGKGYYIDDDDKWLGGIVYYNPNDSRLVINDRVGTNSGVNLAKPMGKVLYALIVILLLTIPFWGLFIDFGGDLTLEMTDSQLLISDEYTVERNEILQVTLLEELPAITRIFGTGLPEYLAGDFSSKEYGKLKVCLDPTSPPFVLIKTPDTVYLAGTRDQAVTEEIYNALK
ncbi:MAG: hypothetical protein J6J04_03350 [Oscillospiraceae bacterium]|nr:hypothetical protein [Oscillospiraceae bacterium]